MRFKTILRARDWITGRKAAYQYTFGSVSGMVVLRDLAQFCRATESTYNDDARLHAVAEGRREVWLRIQQHLELPEHELWQRYGIPEDQRE